MRSPVADMIWIIIHSGGVLYKQLTVFHRASYEESSRWHDSNNHSFRRSSVQAAYSISLCILWDIQSLTRYIWSFISFHLLCASFWFFSCMNIFTLSQFFNINGSFHIRTVQHLGIITVLFIHQLMHWWVVLKNNIKIYSKIYIKTALTCFDVRCYSHTIIRECINLWLLNLQLYCTVL